MKESTGELSMTVVTIIAIVVLAGIIAALRGPITNYISGVFMNTADTELTEAN